MADKKVPLGVWAAVLMGVVHSLWISMQVIARGLKAVNRFNFLRLLY